MAYKEFKEMGRGKQVVTLSASVAWVSRIYRDTPGWTKDNQETELTGNSEEIRNDVFHSACIHVSRFAATATWRLEVSKNRFDYNKEQNRIE